MMNYSTILEQSAYFRRRNDKVVSIKLLGWDKNGTENLVICLAQRDISPLICMSIHSFTSCLSSEARFMLENQ